MYEAKVLADSICNGHRLTTMQLTHPRIIHAEFNTHCMFARNASSSRAIPFEKMVQRVIDDPYVPRTFGVNEPGMQAFSYLQGLDYEEAKRLWLMARDNAIIVARLLADKKGLNVHKQIVNRLLEPWMWITVCVTGDAGAWSNYFALRCHKDAAEAIADQAYMAQLVYFKSTPKELVKGEWHTPYIIEEDYIDSTTTDRKALWLIRKEVSIGRCARTSYLTQEGKRDHQEDVKLFERLKSSTPMHASPFEHVCEAMGDDKQYAKYIGWRSYRHIMPNEYVTDFKPNHPELV
jgi:thymidylate synthase ThyX